MAEWWLARYGLELTVQAIVELWTMVCTCAAAPPGYRRWRRQGRRDTSLSLPVAARCDGIRQTLMTSASTASHVAQLVGPGIPQRLPRRPGVVTSLVEGVGAAAAPSLAAWLNDRPLLLADRRRAARAAGASAQGRGVRSAFRPGQWVGRAAVAEAATRFPARAVRLLAAAADNEDVIDESLRWHVLGHRDLARALLGYLPDAAATQIVRAIVDEAALPIM